VQRAKPSAGVQGAPKNFFFFFGAPPQAAHEEGERSRGHPCNPGQGLAALDYPACEGAEEE